MIEFTNLENLKFKLSNGSVADVFCYDVIVNGVFSCRDSSIQVPKESKRGKIYTSSKRARGNNRSSCINNSIMVIEKSTNTKVASIY